MKKPYKHISIILVFVLTILSLTSCGLFDNTGNENNKDIQENAKYYAVKTLYSYSDTMDALEIVREKYNPAPVYTVDGMGDEYTVFYHFFQPHNWTVYPIDYETYFTTKSRGSFMTLIFFENESCEITEQHTRHASDAMIYYKDEEDYEKLREYAKTKPCVWMYDVVCNVEIEDVSLLTHDDMYMLDGYFNCDIRYNGKMIMELRSCKDLDEDFFTTFFNSIVTTKVDD